MANVKVFAHKDRRIGQKLYAADLSMLGHKKAFKYIGKRANAGNHLSIQIRIKFQSSRNKQPSSGQHFICPLLTPSIPASLKLCCLVQLAKET